MTTARNARNRPGAGRGREKHERRGGSYQSTQLGLGTDHLTVTSVTAAWPF
jgi:hypothetical protein